VAIGSDTRFEEFCVGARPPLVGALALHCGDRGIAEELAQEAFVRTWQRWDEVELMRSPAAWTYRVAFNLSTSWYRKRLAERRARRRQDQAEGIDPDHAQALVVRAAVSSLPPRRRMALVLRYYLDLSVAEAAEVMGCREGTVKALCAQAVASLRALPTFAHAEDFDHD
jgi:RNA polymerase sigma-70 factor (sigma-E family)